MNHVRGMLLCLIAGIACAAPAAASIVASAECTVSTLNAHSTISARDDKEQAPSANARCSNIVDRSTPTEPYRSSSSASSYASYGVLKAATVATGTNGAGGAHAYAMFDDYVTINADGMTGKHGTLTASLAFNWRAVTMLDGYVTTGVQGNINLYGNSQYSQRSYSSNLVNDYSGSYSSETFYAYENGEQVAFTSPMYLHVDFTFGSPFLIRSEINLRSGGGVLFYDASAWAAIFNASHSAYWGGISSVMSPTGAVQYTIESASGTDWSLSQVPTADVSEPEALGLIGLGLIALLTPRFRQRFGGRIA